MTPLNYSLKETPAQTKRTWESITGRHRP